MPSTPFQRERFLRPDIGYGDVLRKNAGGMFRERDEYVPFMFRAVVVAVDPYGGCLENPDGKQDAKLSRVEIPYSGGSFTYKINPTKGPKNPKGSLRARVISNDMDNVIDDDHLTTYWPLFPGFTNPEPGGLVYVVFEDTDRVHGLWLAKVPMPIPDQSANGILWSDVLQTTQGVPKSDLFGDVPREADTQPRPPMRGSNVHKFGDD